MLAKILNTTLAFQLVQTAHDKSFLRVAEMFLTGSHFQKLLARWADGPLVKRNEEHCMLVHWLSKKGAMSVAGGKTTWTCTFRLFHSSSHRQRWEREPCHSSTSVSLTLSPYVRLRAPVPARCSVAFSSVQFDTSRRFVSGSSCFLPVTRKHPRDPVDWCWLPTAVDATLGSTCRLLFSC